MKATARQFRFAYFTSRYYETVSFYADLLGLPTLDAWDRSIDDKGTAFGAASGRIEVLHQPSNPTASEHFFDERPPQGAFMVIEVDDVDECHSRMMGLGIPIERSLADRSWGHRSFVICEPNGLKLYFYSELRPLSAERLTAC